MGVVQVEEKNPEDVERVGGFGSVLSWVGDRVDPVSMEEAGIRKTWICLYFFNICHGE